MKNNIKVIILSLVVAFGAVSGASAANLNFSADYKLTFDGIAYTISSGSAATSMVVGDTTLMVTVPTGSTFTLVSGDGYKLNNDSSIAQTCTATQNSLTITGNDAAVVVTPQTVVCGSAGSGGAYIAPVTTTTSTVPTTTTTTTPTTTSTVPATTTIGTLVLPFANPQNAGETAANRTALLAYIVSLIKPTTTQYTVSTSAIPATGKYKMLLYVGMSNGDISALQQFLKDQGSNIYPEGRVTGYFGAMTMAAVGRFQLKYGIVSSSSDVGYGIVGPKTRAQINSLLGL